VYSLGFHPTEKQPIIFVGDKEGNMGLVKAVADPEEEDESWEFKQHERTITSFAVSPVSHNIYSGSYDTSIRRLDTEKMKSIDIYAPGKDSQEGISCIDMIDENTIFFSTLEGRVGRLDVRTPGSKAVTWQLSDNKIGGFSVRPFEPNHIATASLDRTLKVWDLRKIKKEEGYGLRPALVGEHASRLSVSHAAWSASGTHIATSSYDDTIKIHSFTDSKMWATGKTFDDAAMEPSAIIRHNNQTGRWVTILKPHWQQAPKDNIEKVVIGNMNRFIDIFAADGTQLGQLGGDELTAVPAVAQFHPTMGWVAGGNASGKVSLWIGPDDDSAWQEGK
jgi:WD40 repeat protein